MPESTAQYSLGEGSIYVDTATGGIVTVMDASRAAYAWIYYALHTFNFPGLSSPPAAPRDRRADSAVVWVPVQHHRGVVIGLSAAAQVGEADQTERSTFMKDQLYLMRPGFTNAGAWAPSIAETR